MYHAHSIDRQQAMHIHTYSQTYVRKFTARLSQERCGILTIASSVLSRSYHMALPLSESGKQRK